jgi:hypothetical protein
MGWSVVHMGHFVTLRQPEMSQGRSTLLNNVVVKRHQAYDKRRRRIFLLRHRCHRAVRGTPRDTAEIGRC